MALLSRHVAFFFVYLSFCRESLATISTSCTSKYRLKPTDTCSSLARSLYGGIKVGCSFQKANGFPCTASSLRNLRLKVKTKQGAYICTSCRGGIPSPNPVPSPDPIDTDQSNALLAIRARFPNYSTLSPFNSWTGDDCRRWKSVTCDWYGRVTGLSLNGLGLETTLTDLMVSMVQLPDLNDLDLSSNNITGEIPKSISSLTKLYRLKLSSNKFGGSIPETIGNLAQLRILDLSNNRLVGPIPTSISSIGLTQLILNDNLLSGPLFFQFDSSLSQSNLKFQNNFFSGRPSIFTNGSIAYNCSLVSGNCFAFDANLPQICTQGTQRTVSECSRFCEASQPMGACGGHGICPGLDGSCACDPGYSVDYLPNTCTFGVRGRGLTTSPQALSPKLNKFFRYASTGYLNSIDDNPSWLVATSWNWRKQRAVQEVYDQQNCSTCWFVAAVSAIESASYISNPGNRLVPAIAMNQVLQCSKFNTTCSDGGWPSTAFDFAATDGLILSDKFLGTSSCMIKQDPSSLSILSYERIRMGGWLGILLALQQQPAVMAIEASSASFINYNPQLGVFADEECFANGVDHAVVVVGYDLTAATPYWLIRNSWGVQWGDKGYMRIKISGGYGICGINTQPALVPIMKINPNDPCNSMSFARTKLKVMVGPGNMNPCGNGLCTPSGSQYACQCMDNFVAVTNTDGTATCAPVSPCTFTSWNPCGPGTCVDSGEVPGTYNCLCIPGYTPDETDGSLTCVPGTTSSAPVYIVPGGNISCSAIWDTYGIPVDTFMDQNGDLFKNQVFTCDQFLPKGIRVNVTSSRSCSIRYAVNVGDTCASIRDMFNISDTNGTTVSYLETLNPNLDCSNLKPFQQICVEGGSPTYFGPCTLPYDVKQGETCATIIYERMNGNARGFYALNPGVYCGRLESSLSIGGGSSQEVCLRALDLGSASAACLTSKPYTLQTSDNCPGIISAKFKGKKTTFKDLNKAVCTPGFLRSIRAKAKDKNFQPIICVPK